MSLNKPWTEYSYVGFDTETSGKYPLCAEVVEVAATKWANGKVVDTYQSLVKPIRPMGEQVIAIHGITNEMVQDAPPIKKVVAEFAEFIKGSVPIAHHAAFDMGFLAPEYELAGLTLPEGPVIDSCFLGQKVIPRLFNYRLATLVKELGVIHAKAHRALEDSQACLDVALKLMEKAGSDKTLDEILKIQAVEFFWPRYSLKDISSQSNTYMVLIEASRGQLVTEITYDGGSQPGAVRQITPAGLVRTHQGDYIVAMCHREHREKRFYVNRISSAKILD
jgi:DNA polymerase-3 subunit epsilon